MIRLLCRHHATYRERIAGVMWLKCERCHKPLSPVVSRTSREQKRITRIGAVKSPKAQRVNVVEDIRRKRA